MGEEKFKAGYGRTRGGIRVHSVHHDENEALMVIEFGAFKAATFFVRGDDGTFLEVVDTANVSKKLNRQFYIAKGEPDAELAGD